METVMNIENRRLSTLLPAEYNPRVELTPDHPEYQKIKRSIETFGYVDPIIINKDGAIIGGHQRYNVLVDLGYSTAQVVVVDLDKQREKELNIALNKIDGEWDELKLKDLLSEISLDEGELELTGFTQPEFEDLCIRLEVEKEARDDGFDPEEMEKDDTPPVTKRGDLWILGEHRLFCGDATDPDDMAALMSGALADLIITDPPYNVDYQDKQEFTTRAKDPLHRPFEAMQIQNDHLDDEAFLDFLRAALQNSCDVATPGAAFYCFYAAMQADKFIQAFADTDFSIKQHLVWEKNHFALSSMDYHWRHEPIMYGWKKGAAHYFIHDRTQDTVLLEDDIDFDSMKKQELVDYIRKMQERLREYTTVLYENKPQRNDVHPTMKPVPLIGRLMKNSSKPGANVLDPFGGSGSTLIAAEQLDRKAFLMELDEKYCDVIVRRWEEFTGQEAILWDERKITL
ncbi:MAG: site-specific DNA-methyltransferase [Lachnospiraceae bacterium]|nr:site-specific DNA-methyltransferase [Lachnospiraceae bacterium]